MRRLIPHDLHTLGVTLLIFAAAYVLPIALMAGLVTLGLYADPQAVTA